MNIRRSIIRLLSGFAVLLLLGAPESASASAREEPGRKVVDASALKGKVLCGYQGWFRCRGDASGLGWVHWSRESGRIASETLTFDMWPEMWELPISSRFKADGMTYLDGRPAELFSSDDYETVNLHFRWMRDHGIDGVWLQHFVVELQGGPGEALYPSRRRVLEHVRKAAKETGRAWALTFDVSGMPIDRCFDVLTTEWRSLVALGATAEDRYLKQGGKPVVQIWGVNPRARGAGMTIELANRLVDFFQEEGPNAAFVVGGCEWGWRTKSKPAWRSLYHKLDGISPWNVGNYGTDNKGEKHASTGYWKDDKAECDRLGILWLPVVYPGFSWKNLKHDHEGKATIPRLGGRFLWEQFHSLARLKVDSATVAMFDEVDEGTAIFKIRNDPPAQGSFVDYEGLPSDWYLRIVGEGTRMLRGERPISETIPLDRSRPD